MSIRIKNCICIKQTEKAILVESQEFIELGEKNYHIWIPQSEIHEDSEIWKLGQTGILIIKNGWFAEQKNWI